MTEPGTPDPINPNEGAFERVPVDGPPPRKRRDFLPLVYLLGFLVLAGSLFYLWRNPSLPPGAEEEAARVDTLQGQIHTLTNRLAQLEQRPAPASAAASNLAPLESRIVALERRPEQAAAAPTDLGPLTARLDSALAKQASDLQGVASRLDSVAALAAAGEVQQVAAAKQRASDQQGIATRLDALEGQQATATEQQASASQGVATRLDTIEGQQAAAAKQQASDLQAVTTRLDTIEGQQATTAKQQASDLQGVTTRLDTMEGQQATTAKQQASDLQGVTTRLDAMEGRLAAVEKQGGGIVGQISGITERAQRMTRVQAATAALEAGQRLGDIPGAPPALAQFAHDAPPTEASLRLSFNKAAEAAQHASQPAIMDNQPFASRLWTRAQQSVTVRQGDHVLLGDPVSGVLDHARQALDAGDLSGAISVLNGLAGPAAAAMADWVGQARALLEARAALASMAARG